MRSAKKKGQGAAKDSSHVPDLPRLLDLEHLRHLTLGDPELERELLGLFRVQARVQFKLIAIARRSADFQLAVHTLKGAALAVGALAIAAAARELETLGFEGDAAGRRDAERTLSEQIAATEAEIAEIIG